MPPREINYALLIFVRDTRPETISPPFLPRTRGPSVALFIVDNYTANRTSRCWNNAKQRSCTSPRESRNREATSNATLVVYLNRPSLFRVSRACAAVGTRGNFPTPSFHCPRRDFSSREPMALSYRRARSTDAFFQTIQIDHRRPENIPRRESRIKSDRFLPVSLRNRRDM